MFKVRFVLVCCADSEPQTTPDSDKLMHDTSKKNSEILKIVVEYCTALL